MLALMLLLRLACVMGTVIVIIYLFVYTIYIGSWRHRTSTGCVRARCLFDHLISNA